MLSYVELCLAMFGCRYCLLLAVPGVVAATYSTGWLANLMLMPTDRWFEPTAITGPRDLKIGHFGGRYLASC